MTNVRRELRDMMNTPGADAPYIVRFADVAARLPPDSWCVRRHKSCAGEFADARVLWVPGSCHFAVLDLARWPLPRSETEAVFMVVIEGDLNVGTLYNWDTDGCTGLTVLGDLSLNHAVVGGQEIFVCGNLDVSELFWGDYNHGGLQVNGRIRARLLLATDEYHLPEIGRDCDEIGLLLNDDVEQDRDLVEVAAQYFVEGVLNRREPDPAGLCDVVLRYRVVEALLRGEAILRTPFEPLRPVDVPRLWGEVVLTDRSSMVAQASLFRAFVDIVPASEPEQTFRSQQFAAEVFVTRRHQREGDGVEVPDMLVILGDDGMDVRMWDGHREGMTAMFEDGDPPDGGFRPIWDHPEVIVRLQGVWNEALRRAEAWHFWIPQLQQRATTADILALLELPIVKEHYNDWEDSDKNGFWDGFLHYAFHRPFDNEPWAVLRLTVERRDVDEFDIRGYFFAVDDIATPGPAVLRYRSSQEGTPEGSAYDRYNKESIPLSVFDAARIEEALRWFERCAKRLPLCAPENEDDDEDGHEYEHE